MYKPSNEFGELFPVGNERQLYLKEFFEYIAGGLYPESNGDRAVVLVSLYVANKTQCKPPLNKKELQEVINEIKEESYV